jgi:molecular chaperone GrpE
MSNDAHKDVVVEQSDPATVEKEAEASGNPGPNIVNEKLQPVDITPDEIVELKTKAAKADENWERLLRATADFDNYKKRMTRERQEAIRFANESLLEKLIPVLDNFDMALVAANNPQANTIDSLKTGVQMIYNQLKGVVTESGLEEIDATNQAFDPNWHEAVAQQDAAGVREGQVLQQMRKGYKLRDRLIRPASVVVAKKPA